MKTISTPTILAPADFSPSSINAVLYAADFALYIRARLVLFHAIPFPIVVSEISVPGDFVDDMMEECQKEMDDLYEKIQLRTKNRISVSTDIRIGTVEQEIENISSSENPLAIVMGIRSGKSIERALMGSSIFHIMNHAGFPTLIIPENVQFEEIRNIGIACDFKKIDEEMPFDTIKKWLTLFKPKVEIINITRRENDFKADQVADSLTVQTRLKAFKPNFHFLTSNNIPEELNKFVNAHPLDLLMVFPGNQGIFSLFRRKNSKSIITHSTLPILSIHDNKF